MKGKIEKLKKTVSEHKTEIIGAGLFLCGGLCVMALKKKPEVISDGLNKVREHGLTKMDIPQSLVGNGVYEISSTNPEKYWDIWMDNVPLSELGEVGVDLCNTLGVCGGAGFSGVVSVKLTE